MPCFAENSSKKEVKNPLECLKTLPPVINPGDPSETEIINGAFCNLGEIPNFFRHKRSSAEFCTGLRLHEFASLSSAQSLATAASTVLWSVYIHSVD